MRSRTPINVRTDLWREGKWLDLWSVVHLLSGISVGLGLYLLHWGPIMATLTAMIGFVFYEMWEDLMDIKEMPTNRYMDVVVGAVGFTPTFFWGGPTLGVQAMNTFLVVLTLNLVLGFIGWRVSSKANELRRRMKAGYARRKAWLMRQRERARR